MGAAAARNTGARAAAAAWVGFLDDDDLWAPDRLAQLIGAARSAGAGFAYSEAVLVDERLRPLFLQPAPDATDVTSALRHRNPIPGGGSGLVISAQAFEQCGGFDERLSYLADWELAWRLAQQVGAVGVPQPLVAYSIHQQAWTLRDDPAIWHDLTRLSREHPEIDVDPNEYAQHVAHRMHLTGQRGPAVRRYAALALRHRDPRNIARAMRALGGRDLAVRLRLQPKPPPPPAWLQDLAAGQ